MTRSMKTLRNQAVSFCPAFGAAVLLCVFAGEGNLFCGDEYDIYPVFVLSASGGAGKRAQRICARDADCADRPCKLCFGLGDPCPGLYSAVLSGRAGPGKSRSGRFSGRRRCLEALGFWEARQAIWGCGSFCMRLDVCPAWLRQACASSAFIMESGRRRVRTFPSGFSICFIRRIC